MHLTNTQAVGVFWFCTPSKLTLMIDSESYLPWVVIFPWVHRGVCWRGRSYEWRWESPQRHSHSKAPSSSNCTRRKQKQDTNKFANRNIELLVRWYFCEKSAFKERLIHGVTTNLLACHICWLFSKYATLILGSSNAILLMIKNVSLEIGMNFTIF